LSLYRPIKHIGLSQQIHKPNGIFKERKNNLSCSVLHQKAWLYPPDN